MVWRVPFCVLQKLNGIIPNLSVIMLRFFNQLLLLITKKLITGIMTIQQLCKSKRPEKTNENCQKT
jgi:hypothetical protein